MSASNSVRQAAAHGLTDTSHHEQHAVLRRLLLGRADQDDLHRARHGVDQDLRGAPYLQHLEGPAGAHERGDLLEGRAAPGSEEEVGRHELLHRQERVSQGGKGALRTFEASGSEHAQEEGGRRSRLQQLPNREEHVELDALRPAEGQVVRRGGEADQHQHRRRRQHAREAWSLAGIERAGRREEEERAQSRHLKRHVPDATERAVEVVDVVRAEREQGDARYRREEQEGGGPSCEGRAQGLVGAEHRGEEQQRPEHRAEAQEGVRRHQHRPLSADLLPDLLVLLGPWSSVTGPPEEQRARDDDNGHQATGLWHEVLAKLGGSLERAPTDEPLPGRRHRNLACRRVRRAPRAAARLQRPGARGHGEKDDARGRAVMHLPGLPMGPE
mmetsp:Transcript_17064/g.53657  ORF Transcript_17064/g.53657 Transcript_17064/m.53657 type:complete len:386 (+) Transcript_17064:1-1158(+)